jgi:hypothetical protein
LTFAIGDGSKGAHILGKDWPVIDGIVKAIGRQAMRRAPGGVSARLLALLWLFVAVLSMPLVASAQIVASGSGAFGAIGNLAGRDGRASDTALSRQALRAAQPADLRFTAERVDAKPLPGGPDPFLLPVVATALSIRLDADIAFSERRAHLAARVLQAAQARAPPTAFGV